VIGDCIHNSRSSLDHLVLQLAVLNGAPKAAERQTAFPICLDSGAFKKAVKDKVAPFIGRAALTAIEELQPYRTLDPATNAPLGNQSILWVLSQLDIIDKHRTILVASPQVAAEGFTVNGSGGEVYDKEISPLKWKPLQDGQEIIRFDLTDAFRAPGGTKMRVEFATIVHFVETGLSCDGQGVQSTLEDCIRVVTHIIDDFGKRFFGG
jgi:hypothetical protein